ncbi:MAG: transcription antitermination factor NusB, partial [Acidimicrobiales bacterium]
MAEHPKREARERALELLYEAEAKDLQPGEVVASLPVAPVPYAAALAEGAGDHRELLDLVISGRAARWPLERMPAVDRALLRLGAYELAFETELPEGVILNEMVELAKSYSTDHSGTFVNGVLGAVVRDVRGDGNWARVAWPDVLIIDIDGVVRHWDLGEIANAEEALGLESGALAAVALEPYRVLRANAGELTDDAWRAEVAEVMA